MYLIFVAPYRFAEETTDRASLKFDTLTLSIVSEVRRILSVRSVLGFKKQNKNKKTKRLRRAHGIRVCEYIIIVERPPFRVRYERP